MSTTLHTLAPCTDCGYRAVLVDGRCPRCQRSLNAEAEAQKKSLNVDRLKAELAAIAKERDALKQQVFEQAALRDRMHAAIDRVRHQGLRRMLWLVPLGDGSRYSDLMRVLDHDETQEVFGDLANDLMSEGDCCQAEYLVRRAMGLDE